MKAEYEAKGALDSDASLVIIGPSVATDRGRTKQFNQSWKVAGGKGRGSEEVSSLRLTNLPVRPCCALTMASAQGITGKFVAVGLDPLPADTPQRLQEDAYVGATRAPNAESLAWHMSPERALALKAAFELGPAPHVKRFSLFLTDLD